MHGKYLLYVENDTSNIVCLIIAKNNHKEKKKKKFMSCFTKASPAVNTSVAVAK